jgi:hypothetical protein
MLRDHRESKLRTRAIGRELKDVQELLAEASGGVLYLALDKEDGEIGARDAMSNNPCAGNPSSRHRWAPQPSEAACVWQSVWTRSGLTGLRFALLGALSDLGLHESKVRTIENFVSKLVILGKHSGMAECFLFFCTVQTRKAFFFRSSHVPVHRIQPRSRGPQAASPYGHLTAP